MVNDIYFIVFFGGGAFFSFVFSFLLARFLCNLITLLFCFKITTETVKFFGQFLFFINQKRGVDDKDLLPYFPYRDDGEKILEVIEHMVTEYIDL